MAKTLNADEFAQCTFTWQGKHYKFYPASVKDLIEYYEGDLEPRLMEAKDDARKILDLHKEALLRRIPEMTSEVIDSLPQDIFWRLVRFSKYGEGDDGVKNS